MHLVLLLVACTRPDAGPGRAGTGGSGTGGDSGSGVTDSGGQTDSGAPSTSGSWQFGDDTVSVDITDVTDGLRTYVLTSDHPQRDDGASERSVTEEAGDPLLRSGVLLTDALFAMAVDDARLNAVSEISDAAFADPVACECYQTGELWSWVWTRDIAYATELGLAWLDPERAAASLLFKLSELKTGGGLQIVQDTGTGGSWPVSTDRVAWARGAMAVLRVVDHPELREAAIEAMTNTAATDRLYAFDSRDGLYRGETSFLDWREQSYPSWTAEDVVHIGMSKSLSTNLDHLFLLRSLEELTGEAHGAEDLATAIDAAFWTGDSYSSYLGTELDPAPVQRQDLLSTSLAVLDLGTHPEALAAYPHGPYGPPVIWPQQQGVPIYHNRATWPFVTAYGVLAARAADNGAVFDAGLDALVRGAALNLSHMENFEVETGANWREDGDASGPVVNSRRQLWSVAGFLGAVVHGVFGVRYEDGVATGDPKLPGGEWFTSQATLTLGELELQLDEDAFADGSVTYFDATEWTGLYGAAEPELSLSGSGDTVTISLSGEDDATFSVFRDGQLAASDVGPEWADSVDYTACYASVSTLVFASQPSAPQCWWGDDYARIQSVPAADFDVVGGAWSSSHGRDHYDDWGEADHTMTMVFTPDYSGEHLLQLVYGNGAGGVDTGVTAAVKWLEVRVAGSLVGEGPVLMPHLGTWDSWADSSFLPVTLTAGTEVELTLRDGMNMSYLAHYEDYVGGRGGGEDPSNYVNIAELKVLFMR